MGIPLDVHAGDVLLKRDGLPFLFFASAAPTDGTDGYAIGAICIVTVGGAGITMYVNEGTVTTSCDFNAK